MKKIYLVAGANGSGKTTFAKKLSSNLNLPFVNADEIAKELDPQNTTGGKMTAGRVFFANIEAHLNKEESFILESTLSGKYLLKLIRKAKKIGYNVELVYIFLENPKVCIERVKERVLNGGHHVPDEDVIRRFYRSKNNFWHVYKDLVDNWLIIYNSVLSFKQFCVKTQKGFSVSHNTLFEDFMKDVDDEQ